MEHAFFPFQTCSFANVFKRLNASTNTFITFYDYRLSACLMARFFGIKIEQCRLQASSTKRLALSVTVIPSQYLFMIWVQIDMSMCMCCSLCLSSICYQITTRPSEGIVHEQCRACNRAHMWSAASDLYPKNTHHNKCWQPVSPRAWLK